MVQGIGAMGAAGASNISYQRIQEMQKQLQQLQQDSPDFNPQTLRVMQQLLLQLAAGTSEQVAALDSLLDSTDTIKDLFDKYNAYFSK